MPHKSHMTHHPCWQIRVYEHVCVRYWTRIIRGERKEIKIGPRLHGYYLSVSLHTLFPFLTGYCRFPVSSLTGESQGNKWRRRLKWTECRWQVNTEWGAFTVITGSLGGCDAQDVHSGDTVMDERKTCDGMHEWTLHRGTNGQTVNPHSLCVLPTHTKEETNKWHHCMSSLQKRNLTVHSLMWVLWYSTKI